MWFLKSSQAVPSFLQAAGNGIHGFMKKRGVSARMISAFSMMVGSEERRSEDVPAFSRSSCPSKGSDWPKQALERTPRVAVRESSPMLVKTPLEAQYCAILSPNAAASVHTMALHCSLRHELVILRILRHCSPDALFCSSMTVR